LVEPGEAELSPLEIIESCFRFLLRAGRKKSRENLSNQQKVAGLRHGRRKEAARHKYLAVYPNFLTN
jgi:hypothetical protein